MKTKFAQEYLDDPKYHDTKSILEACVHCGFCTATCPTYLEFGDERDSPRGRIYLMRSMFEGNEVTSQTRRHLDRCLTCRSCETTCPSGVRYSHLLELGRMAVEEKAPRSILQRTLRWGLRQVLPYRHRFAPLLWLGQLFRPLLPKAIKHQVPPKVVKRQLVVSQHTRIMLNMPGCVQANAAPNTDLAAAKVLDRLGIRLQVVQKTGCCGAVDFHLSGHEQGLNKARANIDALWPHIEAGAEAIVVTASGCGATLQEYGHLLQYDPQYRDKAAKVAQLSRDLADILSHEALVVFDLAGFKTRVAVHCPCTQQHAMKMPNKVRQLLGQLGVEVTKTQNDHLCCGSAGTYSIFQPAISKKLQTNKLQDLTIDNPELIVTGNIGCQLHLANEAKVPIKHWVEILANFT